MSSNASLTRVTQADVEKVMKLAREFGDHGIYKILIAITVIGVMFKKPEVSIEQMKNEYCQCIQSTSASVVTRN